MRKPHPPQAKAIAMAMLTAMSVPCSGMDEAGARIAEVEAGLRPAVLLAGQPVPAETLASAMARLHVPGVSVAVIHAGRIAWAKGYGVTTPGGPAITPATHFQAGSISKPVAAIAALGLVESGKLALDNDVNEQLRHWKVPASSFSVRRSVTLRALLSHTAGTNVHGFPGYAAGADVPTLLQVLDGRPPANTPAIRVVSEPGEEWRYSGGGYAIVQQLIIDATGVPFAEWSQAHLLTPAGMSRSTFAQAEPGEALHDAALPHALDGRPVPGGAHRYPAAAAGGLWTTPSDLARLLIDIQRALADEPGRRLSPAMARKTLATVKDGHAMGFDTGGRAAAPGVPAWFSKGGDTEGFAAFLVAYSDGGDGAVVMTNGARGRELADALVRSIAIAYDWPDFHSRERAAIEIEPAALAKYVGTYDLGVGRQFTIEVAPGGNALTVVSPGEVPERLYAASPTELFIQSLDAVFVFDRAAAGRAQSGHLSMAGRHLPFHRVVEKTSP